MSCTPAEHGPEYTLAGAMRRWQMKPTFRHVRDHLGIETQHQWSDKAIARTTPLLLGTFPLVTLLVNALLTHHDPTIRATAWYSKPLPVFSNLAGGPDRVKVPRVLLDCFHDLLCHSA
jgi:hypothetical protein